MRDSHHRQGGRGKRGRGTSDLGGDTVSFAFSLCGEPVHLSEVHFCSQTAGEATVDVPPIAAWVSTPADAQQSSSFCSEVTLDVSRCFESGRGLGIAPLFLEVREGAAPLIVLPHPETKRVTLRPGASYELGAFVRRDLVRLTSAHVKRTSGVVMDEMAHRLLRSFMAFHRTLRYAVERRASDVANVGMRIGAALKEASGELMALGITQAVPSLPSLLADQMRDDRGRSETLVPGVDIVVHHPSLRTTGH